MTKKVGPEPSPTASTWPVQPIYNTEKVGLVTLYMASTMPLQSI
jgi:hypothetical protein